MEKSDDAQTAGQRFDIAEIQRIAGMLWKGRIVIALTTALTTLIAITYLHMATYTYTTTFSLIPTQSQPRDVAGQFGGLAAMAGINLPGGTNTSSPFTVYPDTAQTRQVAADMAKNWPELMPTLFKDQWDAQSKTWHAPKAFRLIVIRLVKPILGIPAYPWNPPGPAELQQYILQNVGIAQDKKKAMLTVTLRATDPDFSRRFILALHHSTDNVLRRMTLDRARKYAAYLEKKLMTEQTSVVRDVLTQSLSDQETQVMMGSSDTDFAAQPLAPPESSTRPTSPTPIVVLLVGILAGIFIGGVCVVFEVGVLEKYRWFMRRD